LDNICWTGGEPLLQKLKIYQVISETKNKHHTLETNGDLLEAEDFAHFDHITASPKDVEAARKLSALKKKFQFDIKVVSDGKDFGRNMLKFADYVMPLTTENKKNDLIIARKVWQYCVENNKLFSPRLHRLIFGNKKGI
jgi:organic radical activating enzyme